MSLKLKEEMNHFLLLDVLSNDDDFGLNIESRTFAKKHYKGSHWVIDSFLSFLTSYNEKKTHNMLTLMLDSRFNSLKLIYYFMGCEH